MIPPTTGVEAEVPPKMNSVPFIVTKYDTSTIATSGYPLPDLRYPGYGAIEVLSTLAK